MGRSVQEARGPLRGSMILMAVMFVLCQASGVSAQGLSTLKRVVIDPGHGGANEGALGPLGHLEKDETLRVAYALRARLARDYPDLEVILTRTLDVDVGLVDRIHAANVLEADLFISLHLNSAPNPMARGVEVFYLAADKAMPLVTAGEGSWGQGSSYLPAPQEGGGPVHRVPGEDLATLLADLGQARAHRDSADYAALLQQELVQASRAGGVPSRGVRQANFAVLRGARMPAVVVEFGFLSNTMEERWLTSERMRLAVAGAFSRSLQRLDVVFQKRKYLADAGQGPARRDAAARTGR